jgi:hypothetical protein
MTENIDEVGDCSGREGDAIGLKNRQYYFTLCLLRLVKFLHRHFKDLLAVISLKSHPSLVPSQSLNPHTTVDLKKKCIWVRFLLFPSKYC